MSQLPYMRFFVDAYLGDTQHLTAEENGVYCLILMNLWRHEGYLPDDDKLLARISRVSPKRWMEMKPVIAPLLTVVGDKITQKRLIKEWTYSLSKSAVNIINGALGGRAKALKYNVRPLANAYRSPGERLPNALANGVPYQKKKEREKDLSGGDSEAEGSSAAPDGASSPSGETARGFEEERKTSHPLLETSYLRRARQ